MSGDEKATGTPNTRSRDKPRSSSHDSVEDKLSPGVQENNNNGTNAAADEEESSSRTPSPSPQGPFGSSTKKEVYEAFQKWALKTYGDSAKTKTVTKKKSARIMKILRGEEHSSSENSKFRFWVKAKGFRIGPPPRSDKEPQMADQESIELYVPCTKIGVSRSVARIRHVLS